MNNQQEADDAMDQVKIDLLSDNRVVFLSAILLSLRLNWENVETACTTGKRLIINPEWFLAMSHNERLGLVCHEIGHIMFMHNLRLGDRDPKIWNYAGDIVINLMLLEYGFELPSPGLWGPEYARFKDMSTEQVYDILMDEQPEIPDWFEQLMDIEELDDPEEDPFEIQNIVIRASVQQKMVEAGNLPGEAARLVDELLNPVIAWEIVLQEYLTQFAKQDYSYKRFNKKYMPEVCMPTLYSNSLDKFVGVVDASGSIYDYEFQEFITEIDSAREILTPEETILMSFDTIVRTEKTYELDDSILDTLFEGGGGTNIHPVINRLKELDPEVAIIFTDGYFGRYGGTPPDFPIIWIIKDNPNFECSFGEIIHYD